MARRKIELSEKQEKKIIDMQTGKPVEKPAIPIICERIRFYREARHMEQKELARILGLKSQNTISNWENGRARPDVNLLPGICNALNISLYDLFGMPDPMTRYSARQQSLVQRYDSLNAGHQYAVSQMIDSLKQAEDDENCPDIIKSTYYSRSLAAGTGDPTEFLDKGEPIYLYPSPEINRADCVFSVNGNSMEPDYHSGDLVLVKRIADGSEMNYGDIGAFMVGNETYIKQYAEDGLHSLNTQYPTMHFDESATVYLIGRVIGVLDPKSIASAEEVERYQLIHGEMK